MKLDNQLIQSSLANSLVAFLVAGGVAASRAFLPSKAPAKIKWLFTWLAFDALCHFIIEGSWIYHQFGGRSIKTGDNAMAYLWRDYGRADRRWNENDPNIVSLELLTVFGAGPTAAYCCYLLAKNDSAYHFWAISLSVAELYGGFMTFMPDWYLGSPNLIGPSEPMLFWVYLCFFNLAWVFIPFYICYDSHHAISRGLKSANAGRPLGNITAAKAAKKSK